MNHRNPAYNRSQPRTADGKFSFTHKKRGNTDSKATLDESLKTLANSYRLSLNQMFSNLDQDSRMLVSRFARGAATLTELSTILHNWEATSPGVRFAVAKTPVVMCLERGLDDPDWRVQMGVLSNPLFDTDQLYDDGVLDRLRPEALFAAAYLDLDIQEAD